MCSWLADQWRRLQRIYCAAIINPEGRHLGAQQSACSSAKDDNAPRVRLIRFWPLLFQTSRAASSNPGPGGSEAIPTVVLLPGELPINIHRTLSMQRLLGAKAST